MYDTFANDVQQHVHCILIEFKSNKRITYSKNAMIKEKHG